MTVVVSHVVLLGLMGAGKTTVGRELAAKLSWPMSDSDEVIERVHGAAVRELLDRLGVDGMHELEASHLMAALACEQPQVICAAASVVDVPQCHDELRREDVFTVWLRSTPETLAARFAFGPHRPIYDPDAEALFRRQLRERGDRFATLGPYEISVDGRSPAGVAEELLRELGEHEPEAGVRWSTG